ncbi:hypothetical protein MMC07_004250 [Pseudocyphellaria aurata]|nr:hypothetical protein [Pseudocyphellaria aurata]
MTIAVLKTPFSSLSCDNFIARGLAGHVFGISPNLVLKCPTLFINPAPEQLLESEESVEKIEREKSIYHCLMQHYHPHLIRAVLCTPEGIFMPRLKHTLRFRLNSQQPISTEQECRWIQQLVSAVEWLERLGLAHGDLRPANILLDTRDSVQIGDFDATVRLGEELLVSSAPFGKPEGDFEASTASASSEQFAIGSCIYNIRTRVEPFHDLPGPVMVRKLRDNDFPSTSRDSLFGDIILGCWRGRYSSIRQLKHILTRNATEIDDPDAENNTIPTHGDLLAECEEFLVRNRKPQISS